MSVGVDVTHEQEGSNTICAHFSARYNTMPHTHTLAMYGKVTALIAVLNAQEVFKRLQLIDVLHT
jgi:hypothetical protein